MYCTNVRIVNAWERNDFRGNRVTFIRTLYTMIHESTFRDAGVTSIKNLAHVRLRNVLKLVSFESTCSGYLKTKRNHPRHLHITYYAIRRSGTLQRARGFIINTSVRSVIFCVDVCGIYIFFCHAWLFLLFTHAQRLFPSETLVLRA